MSNYTKYSTNYYLDSKTEQSQMAGIIQKYGNPEPYKTEIMRLRRLVNKLGGAEYRRVVISMSETHNVAKKKVRKDLGRKG